MYFNVRDTRVLLLLGMNWSLRYQCVYSTARSDKWWSEYCHSHNPGLRSGRIWHKKIRQLSVVFSDEFISIQEVMLEFQRMQYRKPLHQLTSISYLYKALGAHGKLIDPDLGYMQRQDFSGRSSCLLDVDAGQFYPRNNQPYDGHGRGRTLFWKMHKEPYSWCKGILIWVLTLKVRTDATASKALRSLFDDYPFYYSITFKPETFMMAATPKGMLLSWYSKHMERYRLLNPESNFDGMQDWRYDSLRVMP